MNVMKYLFNFGILLVLTVIIASVGIANSINQQNNLELKQEVLCSKADGKYFKFEDKQNICINTQAIIEIEEK